MSEVVNFNKARKAAAKAADRQKAAQNRAAFGRSKLEKSLETARAEKARKLLDGKKLED